MHVILRPDDGFRSLHLRRLERSGLRLRRVTRRQAEHGARAHCEPSSDHGTLCRDELGVPARAGVAGRWRLPAGRRGSDAACAWSAGSHGDQSFGRHCGADDRQRYSVHGWAKFLRFRARFPSV